MYKYKRIIVLILDSVGCGYQKDYSLYHQEKCNTLEALYEKSDFCLPTLESLGLGIIRGKLADVRNVAFGKMIEKSKGNDTFAGILEMVGIILKRRFRTNKRGFPQVLLKEIELEIGVNVVGNEYISGF